ILLDKACFADMSLLSKNSGETAFSEYIGKKADITNIIICVRVMRMKRPFEFFEKVYLPGGTLGVKFFGDIFDDGEEGLFNAVSGSAYGKMFANISYESGTGEIEKAANTFLLSLIAEYRKSVFGPKALIGFLLTCENEIKNIRIILAGKKVGQRPEHIRERICYV
ncbi:MAG: V-type ATPase subunit, partial [Eubacteriales bacterium]